MIKVLEAVARGTALVTALSGPAAGGAVASQPAATIARDGGASDTAPADDRYVTVTDPRAVLRCGEGVAYYAVAETSTSDLLRVVRELEGGWLSVAYPRGTEAIVEGTRVRIGPSGEATLTTGSRLIALHATRGERASWQKLLRKELPPGTKLDLAGDAHDATDLEGARWLRVVPPDEAVAYIQQAFVRASREGEIDAWLAEIERSELEKAELRASEQRQADGAQRDEAPAPQPLPEPEPESESQSEPESADADDEANMGEQAVPADVENAGAAADSDPAEADEPVAENGAPEPALADDAAGGTANPVADDIAAPEDVDEDESAVASESSERDPLNPFVVSTTGTVGPAAVAASDTRVEASGAAESQEAANNATERGNPFIAADDQPGEPPLADADATASIEPNEQGTSADEGADKPVTGAKPTTPAMTSRELDAAFRRVRRQPPGEAEYAQLLAQYDRSLIEADLDTDAEARTTLERQRLWLDAKASIERLRSETAASERRAERSRRRAETDTARFASDRPYELIGVLRRSEVYTGVELPVLYRLLSVDDRDLGTTIAYVREPEQGVFVSLVGRVVGVSGRSRREAGGLVEVVEPTRYGRVQR
ncbi:MAG: hypothetical protein AAF108_04590 [Planctomycetota bacterium]